MPTDAPATLDYHRHGTSVTKADAVFTVALRRVDGNWRLAAWAWSNGH